MPFLIVGGVAGGRVALAALCLEIYLGIDRHPDRELLVRARAALDEALDGPSRLDRPS